MKTVMKDNPERQPCSVHIFVQHAGNSCVFGGNVRARQLWHSIYSLGGLHSKQQRFCSMLMCDNFLLLHIFQDASIKNWLCSDLVCIHNSQSTQGS